MTANMARGIGWALALWVGACGSDAADDTQATGDTSGGPSLDADTQVAGGPLSLAFDGSGGAVDFGNAGAVSGASAYSLSVWFKVDALTPWGTLLAKRSSDTDRAVVLQLYGDDTTAQPKLGIGASDGYAYTTADVVQPGVWQHAVMVFDLSAPEASRLTLYVGGVAQAVTLLNGPPTVATPTTPTRLVIGAEYNGSTPVTAVSTLVAPFKGKVDDFSVYGRAITAEEAAALAGGAEPATVDGLVTRFGFDDADLGTVTDDQGQRTGNLVGSVMASEDVPTAQ